MLMKEENVLWKGNPSQLTNFWVYIICAVLVIGSIIAAFWAWPALFGIIIPVLFAAVTFLRTRCRIYELTSERLRLYEGVLNQEIGEVELYRVKDSAIHKPFWLRMVGLGTLVLDTSDRSHPTVEIQAVRKIENVREIVRDRVEALRDQKRVREIDFEGGGAEDFDGDFEG